MNLDGHCCCRSVNFSPAADPRGRGVPGDSDRLWHLHACLQSFPIYRCNPFNSEPDPHKDKRGMKLAVYNGDFAKCVLVDVAAVTRNVDAETSGFIVICECPFFCQL